MSKRLTIAPRYKLLQYIRLPLFGQQQGQETGVVVLWEVLLLVEIGKLISRVGLMSLFRMDGHLIIKYRYP